MAILYRNAKGYEVRTHSYSAGSEFSFCKRKYKLSRIQGWKEKEKRAATFFGECIESAIQFYHANGMKGQSAKIEFARLWDKFHPARYKDELSYTEKEGSWEELKNMGHDMMKLYETFVQTKKIPVFEPKFQLQFKKEVFPGDSELGGIEFTAYVDMLVKVPDPPIGHSEDFGRKIVIDIKTSGVSLPDDDNVLLLDPQLRSYAWVTGIQDVAFLWFVKGGDSLRRGDTVTVLVPEMVGQQMTVMKVISDEALSFVTPEVYAEFKQKAEGLKGKALDKLVEEYVDPLQVVMRGEVTKVKLLFKQVHIPDEDVIEQGQAIGQEIAEIHAAYQSNSFPKEPGIRFPNNKCLMCPMLGICSKNDALRDEKLVNISPQKTDWLDELEKSE